MKINAFHITLLLALLSTRALAQLSPGDLARAHADLEGVFNCTKCHDLGNKVTNAKCLSCHKEIKTRLDLGLGYHAAKDVKAKDCTACHSDHHGRDFQMARFDKNKFNHNQTGYALTGAHLSTDCKKCHQPDFIADKGLKKRSNTYLGLDKACGSCHKDVHQKTLSNDCAKCHTTDKFTPARNFDHNKTDFALLGKHKSVECQDCHKKETRGGEPFQHFAGVPFSNCSSCHDDPHNRNLGANCKECHVELAFNSRSGLDKFNHNQTHFPLKGKHQQTDCAACHALPATPTTVFQDRLGLQTNNCAACHKDVHENKFGTICADCHTEKSFRTTISLKNFNHSLTGFDLEGKHAAVDCRKCHKSDNYTDPLPHLTCSGCHRDYHEGQMASVLGLSPDCSDCHNVAGFVGSTYDLADHAKSKFPLEGAHAASPCFACHKKDAPKWQFRNIGERCVDCHADVHVGYIDNKYYPNQACDQCHLPSSWEESRFNHNLTKFKLQGAHARQNCRACHGKAGDEKPLPEGFQQFAKLPAQCASCHRDAHDRQFEKDGATDCQRCHAFENWSIGRFDHNKTAFKLDGKHAKVACAACHKSVVKEGKSIVQYKFKSFLCIDCHK